MDTTERRGLCLDRAPPQARGRAQAAQRAAREGAPRLGGHRERPRLRLLSE